jgi:hypothetical protein
MQVVALSLWIRFLRVAIATADCRFWRECIFDAMPLFSILCQIAIVQ